MDEKNEGMEYEKYPIQYHHDVEEGNASEVDGGEGAGGDPTLANGYGYQEPYLNAFEEPKKEVEFAVEVSSRDSGNEKKEKGGKNSRGRVLRILASAILFGLVAGTIFQGVDHLTKTYLFKENEETGAEVGQSGVTIPTMQPVQVDMEQLEKQSSSVVDVVDNVMPAIVSIHVTMTESGYGFFGQYQERDVPGSGSGFIVGENEEELLIVTNNHVVEGTSSIEVTFADEQSVSAVVKGTDAEADLAVVAVNREDIKAETREKIKVATLGDSEDVKVGQMAIAIGNALGYGQSVTVGYISAKDREIEVSGTSGGEVTKMKVLQTDAAINPGNSGGALLNVKGEVVGINSVKYAAAEVEGMGYAIPISRALPIINELMKREVLKEEEKGYLGISGTDVSEEANALYGIPFGVLVSEVAESGAAAEAGIQKGDIITKVNDVEVKSIQSLKEKVNSYRVGTEFPITVMRNDTGEYKETVVQVTLKSSETLDSLTEEEQQEQGEENPEGVPNGSEQAPGNGFDEDALEEFYKYFR